MNNKPGTKVRRRQNSNYKCGHINAAKRRSRPSRLVATPMDLRHGKDCAKLQLYKDLQRGVVRP